MSRLNLSFLSSFLSFPSFAKVIASFTVLSVVLVSSRIVTDAVAQEKNVLVEIFTSTTCPPCAPQNTAFNNWLNNYANADRVTVIKYPVWWPGSGCVYYYQNQPPVDSRVSYYGVNGAPTGVVDGIPYGSSASTWTSRANSFMSQSTPVDMSVFSTLNGDETEISVDVTIKRLSSATNYPDGVVKLRVAIVERDLQYNAPNGSTYQDFVHRDMLPNANGTTITLSPDQVETYSFTADWNSSWNKENVRVVAFMQASSNNRIYQSVMEPLSAELFSQSYKTGWNMVSLSAQINHTNFQEIFPNGLSNTLYSFDGSYTSVPMLTPGEGYWLSMNADNNVGFGGSPISSLEVTVRPGWNLIGGLSAPSKVLDPNNIVNENLLYTYGTGYEESAVMEPGVGYWIVATQEGTVQVVLAD